MPIWTTVPKLALLLVLAAPYSKAQERPGAATPRPPEGLFAVGGHRLYLSCTASSAPTVLVDAGFGESTDGWRQVRDAQ